MKKILLLSSFLLALLLAFGADAGKTPKEIILASEEWANATNKDGTGLYWDIFRAVYEPLGVKTKFIIQSYNGSVNLVKRHKADAAVGVYRDAIRGTLVSKYPFDKDYILVLFKKSTHRQWNGQETFKNKKVAWIKGYAFNENLEVPFIKREFEKREDILRLLDKDEVDFFMDTRNDLEAVLNKGIIDVTHYTVESVMELDRFLAFADNQKGRKLKKIFDDRFPLLVKSGKLEQLHAKWNW